MTRTATRSTLSRFDSAKIDVSRSIGLRPDHPAAVEGRTLFPAMAAGEIAHCGRPDLDNLAKAVFDGMNGAVFRDDAQIVRTFLQKIYAEEPGVDVRVEAYAPQEPRASLMQESGT